MTAQPFSSKQEQLLDRLLKLVGQIRKDEETPALTAFLGIRGGSRQGGLAIVGRAPHGWVGGWKPGEFRDPDVRQEVLASLEDRADLGRMADRSTMFWQVARAVANALDEGDGAESTWTDRVGWTNLFKISPAKGGNPSKGLRILQEPLCVQILATEIFLWRPSRILCLTGLSWPAPFLTSIGQTTLTLTDNEVVRATARLGIPGRHEIPVVVAEHPQGKAGGVAHFKVQILDAFGRVASSGRERSYN